MAYSEALASRVRDVLTDRFEVTERKMFGALAFMVNGNMVCGVTRNEVMLRVGAEEYADALRQPGARPMEMGKRTMKSMVVVDGSELTDDDLADRVNACARFASGLLPK